MLTILPRLAMALGLLATIAGGTQNARGADLPTITVTQDDTVIDRSCLVVVPEGTVISDINNNGVIHVTADGIRLQFKRGSVLRGAAKGAVPDSLTGVGVRVAGRKDITILGLHASGFRVGLEILDSTMVLVNRGGFDGMYRQRLHSTASDCRDSTDWLSPHDNDQGEWAKKYGAAISVARSEQISIRRVKTRRSQNGILFDRVQKSEAFDNDMSFLSGWGIALWRSSDNVISRNQLDFCVRGYSDGVYNRGQDSAGILMFEQCSRNVIAENSATHGGDGLFGFAGREAIGQRPPVAGSADEAAEPDSKSAMKPFSYERRGNNDNLIVGNDFSFAAAHGIEMTFSFGNLIVQNRLAENSICGFWGGYSHQTQLLGNIFVRNGQLGYGAERGGVNIEHGVRNRIHDNKFIEDACGVHLWWDDDPGFAALPWAKVNSTSCTQNDVTFNLFQRTPVALQVRAAQKTRFGDNKLDEVERDIVADDPDSVERHSGGDVSWKMREFQSRGKTRPITLRRHLQGRRRILMGDWGPWDFESRFVRPVSRRGAAHQFEFYGIGESSELPVVTGAGLGLSVVRDSEAPGGGSMMVTIVAEEPGAYPYELKFAPTADGVDRYRGVVVNSAWDVRFFSCEGFDPRTDAEAWNQAVSSDGAIEVQTNALRFDFGSDGPRSLGISPELTDRGPNHDQFGLTASTSIVLPEGEWSISTVSDDGVRVRVDGRTIIDRWTHHGATPDRGVFTVKTQAAVRIEVDYFELTGAAMLRLELDPSNSEENR